MSILFYMSNWMSIINEEKQIWNATIKCFPQTKHPSLFLFIRDDIYLSFVKIFLGQLGAEPSFPESIALWVKGLHWTLNALLLFMWDY